MNFKDFVAKDNAVVFINPDEFGEPHMIDDNEYQVVIDYDLINERPHLYAEGTYQSKIIFFIRESDLGYRPVEGQDMRFDGKIYLVAHVAHDMGILSITLDGNGV
jgi:hypothetical protein